MSEADERLAALRALSRTMMAERPVATGVEIGARRRDGIEVVTLEPAFCRDDLAVMHLHGGGFRVGSARGFSPFVSHIAAAVGVRIESVEYRLAPESPFPAALDDALVAYRSLRAERSSVVLMGDSAGGGLAASLSMELAAAGLEPAAGIVLLSPWCDLRITAASFEENAASDTMFSREAATEAAGMYLAGHSPSDPRVSPLLADWSGQPPLLIQASTSEVLRDDAMALSDRARSAGVEVRLRLWPGEQHVWHYGLPESPAGQEAVAEIADFIAGL